MVPSYAKLFAAACGLASTAQAVHPLVVEGKDFVNSVTKDRFQIIGVDYQPGGSAAFKKTKDPLADKDTCLRDAAILQRLGVNAIRVYNLSPALNHDDCASIFNAAGIYMFLDVNSPLTNGALDQTAPWTTYNHFYMQQVFGVIEAFKNYPNTAAFFSANEVISEASVEEAGNYIRAVQRDMHDYIENHSKRAIPVGYSAADVRPLLVDTAYYLSCDLSNSSSSRSDFFGLNSYSWCGDATYKSSGYDVLTEDFKDISMPVFFSETGCNNVRPRVFSEIEAIYGPDMSQSLSGALVYEYSQEDNEYGLVKINSNGSVSLLADFDNLQKQYNKLDLDAITESNSTQTSMDAPKCDPDQIHSNITKSFDIPERVDGIDKLVEDGYTKDVHVGELVDVSETKVSQDVFDTNGNLISDLKLNILSDDAVNTPSKTSSGDSSSASGTSSSDSPASATSSGAASSLTAGSMTGIGGLVALFLMAF